MRLTTKGRYAVRILTSIARRQHNGPVPKKTMSADEGAAWGFHNKVVPAEELDGAAVKLAQQIAAGPNFGHMITKTMLAQEWSMSIEQAIEAEAQAQAICMQTGDFERAYKAFVAREKPVFKGD